MSGAGRFLQRWSRLKREADAPAPAAPTAAPAATPPAAAAAPPAASTPRPDAPSELPRLESLGLDSDFTAFLREEVSESLRRAALKRLFADPHFNRMDGLDVYIDDYSIADPIPPDVLDRLRQAQQLLRGDEPAAAEQAEGGPPPSVAEEAAAPLATSAEPPPEPDSDAPPECDSLGAAGQNVPTEEK